MLKSLTCLVALAGLAAPSAAQETPPPAGDVRSDAPSIDAGLDQPRQVTGAAVRAQGADPLGRAQDAVSTDANAGQHQGSDAGIVTGNAGALIQGGPGQALPPDLFRPGTNPPLPGDARPPVEAAPPVVPAGALDVVFKGYVDAGFTALVFDNDDFAMTFLPRRLELDVDARWVNGARVFIDVGLSTSPEASAIAALSPVLDRDLVDALIEQAFAEWQGGALTLRAGKLSRPFMNEPLDVTERTALSRSSLAQLALPDDVTGLYADYELWPSLTAYALVVNGWDTTVEQVNRSKTLGGGLPHQFGRGADGGHRYAGNLAFLVGAERPGVNDLKWVVNYAGAVELVEQLEARFELVYGAEERQGYNKQGEKDGEQAAEWYGATVSLGWEAVGEDAGPIGGLAGDLRLEALRDPDLLLDLPRVHNLPNLTTLVGLAATVRYAIVRGFDVAVEYKVDFERGDVRNVSIQRNVPSPLRWFKTHELMFDVIGYF